MWVILLAFGSAQVLIHIQEELPGLFTAVGQLGHLDMTIIQVVLGEDAANLLFVDLLKFHAFSFCFVSPATAGMPEIWFGTKGSY